MLKTSEVGHEWEVMMRNILFISLAIFNFIPQISNAQILDSAIVQIRQNCNSSPSQGFPEMKFIVSVWQNFAISAVESGNLESVNLENLSGVTLALNDIENVDAREACAAFENYMGDNNENGLSDDKLEKYIHLFFDEVKNSNSVVGYAPPEVIISNVLVAQSVLEKRLGDEDNRVCIYPFCGKPKPKPN